MVGEPDANNHGLGATLCGVSSPPYQEADPDLVEGCEPGQRSRHVGGSQEEEADVFNQHLKHCECLRALRQPVADEGAG